MGDPWRTGRASTPLPRSHRGISELLARAVQPKGHDGGGEDVRRGEEDGGCSAGNDQIDCLAISLVFRGEPSIRQVLLRECIL